MNHSRLPLFRFLLLAVLALLPTSSLLAQDWPQWRGPNRDAKAAGFIAPKTWPKELTRKWNVTVGEGVATPALVGNNLYVFARQGSSEVTLCLDAADGKERWKDSYDSLGADGPASRFSGPRSSPTVAEGKVVTLGVRGVLSCLDASTGAKVWRKDDFPGAVPRFFPSSSPIIADGLCIAQLGGGDNGAIAAYSLATGEQKWKWAGESPAYASPTLMTVDGDQFIVAQTENSMVAVRAGDGKVAWKVPFAPPQRAYNASSPVIEGATLIYTGTGRGTAAVKFQKTGDELSATELWKNADTSAQFNSPVLKSGLLFGLTQNTDFYCLDAKDGRAAWTKPAQPSAEAAGGGAGGSQGQGQGQGQGRGRGGRGGGGGMRGYGSIVDAGSVLLALTPESQLKVLEPGDKEYKELASYKVAESQTFAYPVASGNRIFIKDQTSVTLWTVD